MRDNYTNNGVNNGIMGPVTFGKAEFQLTPDLVSQIVASTPQGRPVVVRAVGGSRATAMGQSLLTALQHAGFDVTFQIIGMMVPPPDQPVSVSPGPAFTIITIAPSA